MSAWKRIRDLCCRLVMVGAAIAVLPATSASAQVAGACCRPDGSCFTTNLAIECTNVGGTFIPGANCNTVVCRGACCNPATGACAIVTELICRNNGGIWQGVGSSCQPNPCTDLTHFACCLPSGQCFVTNLTSECAFNNGTALPPGSVCIPNPCPPAPLTGPCCINGQIVFLTQADCLAQGGIWSPPGTPPQCARACCLADGTCILVTAATACNGTLLGSTTCTPNPCPPTPTGACCRGTVCQIVTQAQCLSVPGTIWLGPNTTCQPSPCPQPTGACCYLSAASGQVVCQVLIQTECTSLGGVWTAGGSCQPNPCPELYGACCIRIPGSTLYTCVTTTRGKCKTTPFAIWLGFGTPCTPDPCNPPPPRGACCAQDGTCTITTQADCCGIWLGANVPCTPEICKPGACCNLKTGACVTLVQVQCNKIGGMFIPSGTCLPNQCPPPVGACCRGGASCVITTQANCPAPFVWKGANSLCSPNPCCPIDWNDDKQRSPADIFSFLNDYFLGCP